MPPFKTENQRRKFAQMVREGKITQKVFDEFNADSPENLPEKKKTILEMKKQAMKGRIKKK